MHPSAEAIEASVAAAYGAGLQQQGGANADYIPYLAKVPSQLFGIAVMTVDGALFTAGDSGFAFAIESISMVFRRYPIEASSLCTGETDPCTVTLPGSAAILTIRFRRAFWLTSSTTPSAVTVRKPGFSAMTVYLPVNSSSMR